MGSLCPFVAGREGKVHEWAVTNASVQEFAPGMRVAVAAEADFLSEYQR